MTSSFTFPFHHLSSSDLINLFLHDSNDYSNTANQDLKNIMIEMLSDEMVNSLEFTYYTPTEFNSLINKCNCPSRLSMFHVNVRSLNANASGLVCYLSTLTLIFDIIILSEIWSTNISLYTNLFHNYDFFYNLPSGRAGGVGIYAKKI